LFHRAAPFSPDEEAPPLRRCCAACDSASVAYTAYGALHCQSCDAIEDLSPAWEDRFSRSGFLVTRWGRSAGDGLPAELGEEDDRMMHVRDDATARIAHMTQLKDRFLVRLVRERRNPDAFEAALLIELRNCAVALGAAWDSVEGIVHPKRAREHPLAGYRHALAVAFGIDFTPALGVSRGVDERAHGKLPLPQGLQFGTMAVHPTRPEASAAQGEDAFLTRLAAQEAVALVRLDRRFDAQGQIIDEGRPLSDTDIELIKLHDLGTLSIREHRGKKTKGKSWLAKNKTVIPSFDAIPPEEVLDALRGLPDAPETVKQVKLRAAKIRKALRWAFIDCGLISMESSTRTRVRLDLPKPPPHDPYALPGAA
jgi:hypothetical protein